MSASVTRPAHPADPSQPAPRSAHFPLFDSLRAIAALSILFFHLFGFSGVSSEIQPWTGRLGMGVTVFFVTSGFLLYRPFVRAHLRAEPAPMTGPYAWRRFRRIVPAYWVALTVIALVLSRDEVFGTRSAYFYGFIQTFREDTGLRGIGQAWTLAVEMSFYVFLPIWAWLLARVSASTRRRLDVDVSGLVLLLFAPRAPAWRRRTAGLRVPREGCCPPSRSCGCSPCPQLAVGRMGELWLAFVASLRIAGGGWLCWRVAPGVPGVGGPGPA